MINKNITSLMRKIGAVCDGYSALVIIEALILFLVQVDMVSRPKDCSDEEFLDGIKELYAIGLHSYRNL